MATPVACCAGHVGRRHAAGRRDPGTCEQIAGKQSRAAVIGPMKIQLP